MKKERIKKLDYFEYLNDKPVPEYPLVFTTSDGFIIDLTKKNLIQWRGLSLRNAGES